MARNNTAERKKRKWPKVVAWIGCVAVIVAAAGLFAANAALDKMLGYLADSNIEQASAIFDGQTGGADKPAAPAAGEDRQTADAADSSADSAKNGQATDTSGGTGARKSGHSGETGSGHSGAGAAGAGGSNDGAAPESGDFSYSAEVSVEKAEQIRESVTLGEKMTIASILDKSDIDRFVDLAKGGLTVEDKRAARALLLEKLTEDEYDTLIAIAKKYGISQGKTYAEVKKDHD